MNGFKKLALIATASALPLLASAQLAGSGGQPANPSVPSASTRADDPSTAVKTDSATKYGQQGNPDSTQSTTHHSKAKKSKTTPSSDSTNADTTSTTSTTSAPKTNS